MQQVLHSFPVSDSRVRISRVPGFKPQPSRRRFRCLPCLFTRVILSSTIPESMPQPIQRLFIRFAFIKKQVFTFFRHREQSFGLREFDLNVRNAYNKQDPSAPRP
jgi:hypothetical protein